MRLPEALRSLRYRDFRAFFGAQMISQIGSWMHSVPPKTLDRGKKRSVAFKEILSTTLVRDAATRLVFLNLVAWGSPGS